MTFLAKGRVIIKRRTAEEAKDIKIKGLHLRVASHNQPQRKEAGIEQNIATDIIIPKATRGPPRTATSEKPITYRGMKTLSNPNAIS